ncbi:hypothetical protein BHE74_00037669, partial [Ensete ventricosum]
RSELKSFFLMKITEQLYWSLLSFSPPIWATATGGVSMLITLFLSMFLLFQHLSAYNNPEYVSLVSPSISVDCEILRDCYEAFAMYCFGRYLVACLGMPFT